MIELYNINNKYYDYSCGWGDRLIGAMSSNVDYFGTDPNNLLCDKLNELTSVYKGRNKNKSIVDIRCQGSEEFIPEWENTIGFAFSSPPYFGLEDYKVGNQSYKPGMVFNEWCDRYLRNTIKNIHKYLINDGKFIVNINNYDKYNLVDITRRISEDNGFKFYTSHKLTNIKRISPTGGLNDNSEEIMVFEKV